MPDTTEQTPALRQSDDSGDNNSDSPPVIEPTTAAQIDELKRTMSAELLSTLVAVNEFRQAMMAADADPTLSGSAGRAMLAVHKLCIDLEIDTPVMDRIITDLDDIIEGRGTSLWIKRESSGSPSKRQATQQLFYGMIAYFVNTLQLNGLTEKLACIAALEAINSNRAATGWRSWNVGAIKGIAQRVADGSGPQLAVNMLAKLRKTQLPFDPTEANMQDWLQSEAVRLAPMLLMREKKRASKPDSE